MANYPNVCGVKDWRDCFSCPYPDCICGCYIAGSPRVNTYTSEEGVYEKESERRKVNRAERRQAKRQGLKVEEDKAYMMKKPTWKRHRSSWRAWPSARCWR